MSNTIDILIAIDAQTLVEKWPGHSPDNPHALGSFDSAKPYVFMIAKQSFVAPAKATSEGGPELTIRANSGDQIRWSITSPGAGLDNNLILYGFHSSNTAALSPPLMMHISLNEYQPADTNNPTGARTPVLSTDYIWVTTVAEPNVTLTYNWRFMVVGRDNTIQGCYSWDPTIIIAP